ncbi:MAG TPA: NAD-dependent epimerase/dehydratase family protein [Steroidobacteraceae bacterium]
MRLLVTGATGFIGRTLCEVLAERQCTIRAALRAERGMPDHVSERVVIGEIGPETRWEVALRDVDCVVHLAARAHVLNDPTSNSHLYTQTNQLGSTGLALAAARAGVRRFLFLSSVKVNGEDSVAGAFTAHDVPDPQDTYGASKWLAEQAIRDVASRHPGMQVAIVRPPLVYGPGVKANFLRLMRWVDAHRPLPLASIDNRRSLVSVWTLCDLLATLIEHPVPSGTWMVSDGEDLSTPELIRRIAAAMNKSVRLIPVPVGLLRLVGGALGKGAEVRRLCGSLVVDVSETREKLGWVPPMSTDEALRRTIPWYLSEGRSHGA